MKINYGLIAVNPNFEGILHFCGYEDKPTQHDIEHLREELSQDMSFGLTEIMDEVEILDASEEVLKHYRHIIANDCDVSEEEEKI